MKDKLVHTTHIYTVPRLGKIEFTEEEIDEIALACIKEIQKSINDKLEPYVAKHLEEYYKSKSNSETILNAELEKHLEEHFLLFDSLLSSHFNRLALSDIWSNKCKLLIEICKQVCKILEALSLSELTKSEKW